MIRRPRMTCSAYLPISRQAVPALGNVRLPNENANWHKKKKG
jgi:hypothetical protein